MNKYFLLPILLLSPIIMGAQGLHKGAALFLKKNSLLVGPIMMAMSLLRLRLIPHIGLSMVVVKIEQVGVMVLMQGKVACKTIMQVRLHCCLLASPTLFVSLHK